MNADHTFWIGKDHIICEDYSLSGVLDAMSYAVVCDGCSASPDVDMGARIIAHSAKELLFHQINIDVPTYYEEFGMGVIEQSAKAISAFKYISPNALDATLLVVWVRNGQYMVYAYGDGAIVHIRKDKVTTTHIELTSGAPDYLSYRLDKERKARYDSLAKGEKIISTWGSNLSVVRKSVPPFHPVIVSGEIEEGDIIGICSDGINSFRMPDDNPIVWMDLIQEFFGYKTATGQFVLRRIAAFNRKCAKENITHYDDISVASIII